MKEKPSTEAASGLNDGLGDWMPSIEKGIPIPPTNYAHGGGSGTKQKAYPWEDMEPGDSFFVPYIETMTKSRLQSSIHATAKTWATRHGYRLWTTRQEPEGVRIWRVA